MLKIKYIFNNHIDNKLYKLGFKKLSDNNYNVLYERYDEKYNYTHIVCLNHKASGKHIIQSYDKNLFDEKKIGNTCVGLTYKELILFLKKMRIKGWI